MKARNKRFGECLPAVRLYLDDIEGIAQQIHAAGFNPYFADDEYEFSDLEEFINVRGVTPSNFEVGTDTHDLSIDIHRWNFFGGLWFSALGATEREKLAFTIRELLERRRTLLSRVLQPAPWYTIAAFLFSASIISRFVPAMAALAPELTLASVAICMVGMIAQSVAHGFGSQVNLAHRHQTSTFWSRNADKLILAALSGIVGAILKTVWDKLVSSK